MYITEIFSTAVYVYRGKQYRLPWHARIAVITTNTLRLKNVTILTVYNFYKLELILTIFGTLHTETTGF